MLPPRRNSCDEVKIHRSILQNPLRLCNFLERLQFGIFTLSLVWSFIESPVFITKGWIFLYLVCLRER